VLKNRAANGTILCGSSSGIRDVELEAQKVYCTFRIHVDKTRIDGRHMEGLPRLGMVGFNHVPLSISEAGNCKIRSSTQFKRLPDYVLDTHPYHVSITYAWVIQHQTSLSMEFTDWLSITNKGQPDADAASSK
jgi:hypothetical protein